MKALMTLVLVLFLAGYAAGQVHGAALTATEEETTAQESAGDLNRPPGITLSHGEQEVTGALGSYCWGDTCADTIFFVPPRKKTLAVPAGSEMIFRYGGQSSPDTVKARAAPLKANTVPLGTSTAIANPNRFGSLKVQGSGVERTISAELPPGEYVVEMYVREPRGDAVYYFRVFVVGSSAPASSSASSTASATAGAPASVSALSGTGGPISPPLIGVIPLMLVVGGGILSAVVARRIS